MAEKRNPVQVLIENRESVVKAYDAGKGPSGAWAILERGVPEIAASMTFNTFKQYVTPFVMIGAEYEKKLEAVLQERKAESTTVEAGVTRNLKVERWNVHQARDGFFRMHGRYNGRLYSLYLGKVFDHDLAVQKIAARESELGIR